MGQIVGISIRQFMNSGIAAFPLFPDVDAMAAQDGVRHYSPAAPFRWMSGASHAVACVLY